MTAPKNLAASVKARLLALARKREESFNLLVSRYGVERLLYRLSQSRHSNSFLLKGAMLFAIWDEKMPRPTTDVDFLAFGPNDRETTKEIFREVVETEVPADGLVFDPSSISTEEIRGNEPYGGIRVRLTAWLGKGEVPIQIDLGSGDAVTPEPEIQTFPALLDFPAPSIRVYPIYTVVAEKYEAMVKLGLRNTRMKDFHDLWYLPRRFDFDGTTLNRAIRATFNRRGTGWSEERPYPFTEAFATEVAKQTQWSAYLRRNRLVGAPPEFPGRNEFDPSLRRTSVEWKNSGLLMVSGFGVACGLGSAAGLTEPRG